MRRVLAIACVAGCALTSKSPPLEQRYFSAEVQPHAAASASATTRALRLGRVTLAPHLRGAIVHRDSDVELAPYGTLRWSDSPDVYVIDALRGVLFDARRFDQGVAGNVPILDIEVVAFEEIRHGTARSGRVQLRYVLRDDEHVLARGVAFAEKPAADPDIAVVVTAIRAALDAAAGDLAAQLERALQTAAAAR